MHPVAIGAVVLAIISGAAGEALDEAASSSQCRYSLPRGAGKLVSAGQPGAHRRTQYGPVLQEREFGGLMLTSGTSTRPSGR
jgi:hypothetical protein